MTEKETNPGQESVSADIAPPDNPDATKANNFSQLKIDKDAAVVEAQLTPELSVERKSRQLEALVTKAVYLQKKAWFTTCCCVFVCPILIIAIPCILGAVYSNALAGNASNQTSVAVQCIL
jgi:hypothetical protein